LDRVSSSGRLAPTSPADISDLLFVTRVTLVVQRV
jgi:hypothetical protein